MGIPRRVATMTAYDSIERGAADECEPLRGRRSRTFTLTHLLVACGAVCVCAIAATTVVSTHLANFDDVSALANFDLGSAVDDDSAFDGNSAFDDELALADSDDGSDDGSDDDSGDDSDDDSDDDFDDDDFPEEAQLGSVLARDKCLHAARRKGPKYYFSKRLDCYQLWKPKSCAEEALKQRYVGGAKVYQDYLDKTAGCKKMTGPPKKKCFDEARMQASRARRQAYYDYKAKEKSCRTAKPPSKPPSKQAEPTPKPYVKALRPSTLRSDSKCYFRSGYYYGSKGIKACEEKCNECSDCKGYDVITRRRRCWFYTTAEWSVKPN